MRGQRVSISGRIKLRQQTATPNQSDTARLKGRPRQDDEIRRESILEQAYACLVEQGYLATTTGLVAARCHISKQTLYRLFPSKDALFVEVLHRHRRLMLDLPRPPDEDLSFVETLEQIFHVGTDKTTDQRRTVFMRALLRDARQASGLAEAFANRDIERSRLDLAEWLSAQHRLGRIRIENPLSAAQMLMDMAFSPSPLMPQDCQRTDHLRYCLAIFARGVMLESLTDPDKPSLDQDSFFPQRGRE
ncbi:TetR family transcriptional regulator [Agrobacterium vitis]|uniref:TetR family transcriptional regulator n=1 Tax=Agrobacterium vitis TaxID=373 RepID=A0ABD6GGV6_AGRVI|nr:TetR family transcriptional regulator [Agrobacterium vitis]MUO96236.1 TetR family transcriptional regulator [Agrobacterium vitis]MUP05699.1 TetR family transcriptional regulator [Agrobacterium vitis]MUZ82783.1 TetR family transcriptional regulator [Agrobacterium vitis]MVA11841.1 TetR family transcriptional regulator [Agrobacterium vitis]